MYCDGSGTVHHQLVTEWAECQAEMSSSSVQHVASTLAGMIVATAAILAYVNTLPATFTFDDNFAVITNGDVTDDAMPLLDIFRHDFWGQGIHSDMSHKSYRPVTVLSFRWIRQAWMAAVKAWPAAQDWADSISSQRNDTQQQDLPKGLHPFPYHVANVVLHAVASILVLVLAKKLFALLEQLQTPAARAAPQTEPQDTPRAAAVAATAAAVLGATGPAQAVASGQAGIRRRRHCLQAGANLSGSGADSRPAGSSPIGVTPAHPHQQSNATTRALVPAAIAAVLFALHPVHTEAVSGIVGHAELLCACLSIPALLLYMSAVLQPQLQAAAQKRSLLRQWLLIAAAVLLAWAAALSKEIGITIIGTMALCDVLLGQPQRSACQLHAADSTLKAWHPSRAGGRLQLLRLVVLACAGLAYLKLRSWLAGDHLVRIYRKVENPIPFADSAATRVLSTGYLHAKYAHLLLYPMQLAADWSFACVPLVESWRDTRNATTLLLYSFLLFICVQAQPLALVKELLQAWSSRTSRSKSSSTSSRGRSGKDTTTSSDGSSSSSTEKRRRVAAAVARWRLLLVAGLIVGPFLPAANVLFYVGTFIGERLLYFPSIGFCLLLAELMCRWLLPSKVTCCADKEPSPPVPEQQHQQQRQQQQQKPCDPTEGITQTTARQSHRFMPLLWQFAAAAVLVFLVSFYAWRTVERNKDWLSEEALFTSALQVCPDSAKVRLNAGILARRQQGLDLAIEHFRHAQQVEPGYCEPTYWLGITRINQGATKEGMSLLVDALSCKYVAADALKALNKVYTVLMEASPNDASVLLEWGKLLASPKVGRAGDACTVLEDAALQAAHARRPSATIDAILQPCLMALEAWAAGPQHKVRAASESPISQDPVLAMIPAQALAGCVRARRGVYKAIAKHGSASKQVRAKMYAYIRSLEQAPVCRRTASEGQGGSGGGVASIQQKLVNRVQSTDAEDPWLQLEWAQSLLAPGLERAQDASVHLQVAAALFGQVMQAAQGGASSHGEQANGTSKARSLLHPDKALGPEEAAAGAIRALELLASLPGAQSGQRCSALQMECQARAWLAGRLQQQVADTVNTGQVMQQERIKQASASQDRASACMQAVQADAECAQVLQ